MDGFFRNLSNSFGGPIFLLLGFVVMYYTFKTANVDPIPMLTILVLLSPIWLPLSMFYIVFERWMAYVRLKFDDDCGRVTLRIKLPQEVFKSPEAMENVLHQVANSGKATNLMEAYIDGKYPATHSFEIASIGGEVRFYINVPIKKAKNLVESQLYAQYPGIEITEEPIDYTSEIKWDPDKYNLMSFHFTKDNDQIFPIKTYVDWGLDKLPKEEEKVEPMAPLLEYLGNAKPYERLWVQILAIPHNSQGFAQGELFKKQNWAAEAKVKIDELMGRDKNKSGPAEFEAQPRLTTSERDTIAAIERNVSKPAYEVAIRIIYISDKDKFTGEVVTAMLRSMAHYEVVGRNKIGLGWRTDFDYNFLQDRSGRRRLALKKRELDYYKMRYYWSYSQRSGADQMKVMSVEELATIYHVPGSAIATPSLSRVESLRRDAPSNLPTGTPSMNWQ
jgi:hypothetical protein